MLKLAQAFIFFCVIICLIPVKGVQAKSLVVINNNDVSVCYTEIHQKPDFTQCEKKPFYQVDPQHKALWFKATIELDKAFMQRQKPLALFVFGKMSSEVYFNNQLLGNNGTPSHIEENEFPGNMDTRFYVPPQLIKEGNNEVVIYASSHHGLLTLYSPLHFIGLAEYNEPASFFQRDLMISLSLLGALLLGSLYIAMMVYQSEDKKVTALMLLMSVFASVQLFMELFRTLVNYSYPVHDLRLIMIVLSAFGFGLAFLAFTLEKFKIKNAKIWLLFGGGLTALSMNVYPGFDGKTTLALLLPALINFGISVFVYRQSKTKENLIYCFLFLGLSITIVLTFNQFHSLYFYYIVTIVMALLISLKAKELIIEKTKRKEEEEQLLKLKFKLEQVSQQTNSTKLTVKSAGKTHILVTEDILYCKASGDYVDLQMKNKQHHLFHGTLKHLESQLPPSFLKVHRSYLVNLNEVFSINSSKNGSSTSGQLILTTGDDIPVSRRILPQVKAAVESHG